MAIKFREDPDLMFLQFCDNEDLDILRKILIFDKKGNLRWAEKLSKEQRYKDCNRNYKEIWDLIAAELQLFGGDSLVSMFRGRGVKYREILENVCSKVRVKYSHDDDIETLEQNLLLKILEKSFEKMSEEERQRFVEEIGLKVPNFTAQAMLVALQTAIRMGGFASYQIATVVANAVARAVTGNGLVLAANAGLTRWLAVFAGPIGWVITGLLTVPLITGTAYRVTIPACVQVAYMRNKLKNKEFI